MAIATAAFALVSCGSEDPGRASPTQAADEREPADIARALVRRCHGRLAGTFSSFVVEVRDAPDAAPTTILASLPDRLRVTDPDGRTLTSADGDRAWSWSGEGPPAPASTAERDALERWLTVFDLISLGPLERANSVERVGPDRLRASDGDDGFDVEYDPATDALRGLRCATAGVVFIEVYDSGEARVPILVDIDGVGRRHLRFLQTGVDFEDETFEPRAASQQPTITLGGAAGSAVPTIEETGAVQWFMVPDPGTWSRRMELFRDAGRRLAPLGYGNGGDPMLVEDADGRWFVVPFLPAPEKQPDPVVPRDGERVLSRPATRAIVVHPEPGPFDARVSKSRSELLDFAARESLELADMTCVAMNLIGRDPQNDPTSLEAAPLKIWMPIRP